MYRVETAYRAKVTDKDMKWTEIAFMPDAETIKEAAEAWTWMIPEPWKPLVCSMFGGIFLEKQSGGVFWLECGTALVEQVADSAEAFNIFLRAERDRAWLERVDEWFLPGFVQELRDLGKRPGLGQCYGLTILPVFVGGRYESGNVYVLPAREWLSLTGSLHEQIRDVPDGGKVQIKVLR